MERNDNCKVTGWDEVPKKRRLTPHIVGQKHVARIGRGEKAQGAVVVSDA